MPASLSPFPGLRGWKLGKQCLWQTRMQPALIYFLSVLSSVHSMHFFKNRIGDAICLTSLQCAHFRHFSPQLGLESQKQFPPECFLLESTEGPQKATIGTD